MKKYLLVCTEAMKKKFLLLLSERQHFVETSDKYSMQDLLDITSDTLLPELANIHTTWAQHIKTDCQVSDRKSIFNLFLCHIFLLENIRIIFICEIVYTFCSWRWKFYFYLKNDMSLFLYNRLCIFKRYERNMYLGVFFVYI